MRKLSQEKINTFLSGGIKNILQEFNITLEILTIEENILFIEIKENDQIIFDDGVNLKGIPEEYKEFYVRCRIQEMLGKYFRKKWILKS